MKKSPLFLLLSLSIVCWQAKAMERVKEDPLEQEAKINERVL